MLILYFIGFILVVVTIVFTGYLTDVFLYGEERTHASYRAAFQDKPRQRHHYHDYSYQYDKSESHSAANSTPASTNRYSDPYEVHVFDTVEEFYEECGDEFHGFDDAADYFNTYRK